MAGLNTVQLTEAAVSWVSKEFSTMVVTELTDPAWLTRFDVVAVTPNRAFVQIIEVKRTRADFLRGKKEGQFERYMDYCHQFFIAAPAGLLKKVDLPEDAGLLEVWESGTRRLKHRAARRVLDPKRYVMLLERVVQKLLVQGHQWSQETTWKRQREVNERRWQFRSWVERHELWKRREHGRR